MATHKRSATIEVKTGDDSVVSGGRLGTDMAGFAAMWPGKGTVDSVSNKKDAVRHHTVELTDGTSLAVQESGQPGRPALLLLQGQANSHDWWTGLRDLFEDQYRTVTFDYRGTGTTSADEGDWSTALFAADARLVLDRVEAPSAFVFGTSMGGRVAQMLALDSPEYVERLVLACTSPGGVIARERSQQVRKALAQGDAPARTTALCNLMYTPAWFQQRRRSHLLGDPSMTARAQELHLRASGRHDAAARLRDIVAPTLVLHGDGDLLTPVANAQLIAERVPNCEVG
jgi:pimeloyl-ACP methyl ester carboxylesterase